MDAEIAKELFLPWWKIPVYALVVALAITTVRIGIKFDVNVWIAARNPAEKPCCDEMRRKLTSGLGQV